MIKNLLCKWTKQNPHRRFFRESIRGHLYLEVKRHLVGNHPRQQMTILQIEFISFLRMPLVSGLSHHP